MTVAGPVDGPLRQTSKMVQTIQNGFVSSIASSLNYQWKEVIVLVMEVTDIFRGAFLLCNGADLSEIRVRNNGKRIATFLITGKDLEKMDRDYRLGRALVNPLQLRESLNHLRDLMFEKLRTCEGRSRNGDRKRGHRGYQARR